MSILDKISSTRRSSKHIRSGSSTFYKRLPITVNGQRFEIPLTLFSVTNVKRTKTKRKKRTWGWSFSYDQCYRYDAGPYKSSAEAEKVAVEYIKEAVLPLLVAQVRKNSTQ